MGLEPFEVEKKSSWTCFNSAENRAASSTWVGGHRSSKNFCASKLLWVYSDLKLTKFPADVLQRLESRFEVKQKSCRRPSELSYWLESILDTSSPGEGWGGGAEPPQCRPPTCLYSEKKVIPKRSFKSAENRAASSLWVGDHRYTRYLCASKLLWV